MSPKAGRRCVFLDRDGVLNEAMVRQGRPNPPASVDELRILPGVPESCARLARAGFALVVVTNQPDIARGAADPAVVEEIHARLRSQVDLDAIYVCPHDDAANCGCRKPRPGLLVQAASDLGLELGSSYMVGDRWRDVEAGQRAGCRTVFVNRSYDEQRPVGSDAIVASLSEAAAWISADSARVPRAS
jgi:D-glycero-D-manno-heptose 1,7-bisphosphate phosphatase